MVAAAGRPAAAAGGRSSVLRRWRRIAALALFACALATVAVAEEWPPGVPPPLQPSMPVPPAKPPPPPAGPAAPSSPPLPTSPAAPPSPSEENSSKATDGGNGKPAPAGAPSAVDPAASGCWVLSRSFPERECEWVPNACPSAEGVASAERCYLCSRGFGVYATQPECEEPPGPFRPAGGIDPGTYPAPAAPPIACDPSRRHATDWWSPCPHLLPDLRMWQDPATWGGSGVPRPNTVARLLPNTRVLIDSCSFASNANFLTSIIIPPTSEVSKERL